MQRKCGRGWLAAFVAGLASTSAIVQPAYAQTVIRTDGSLGPAVDLGQGDVRIGQELGSTVGNNLFHSFERFDIGSGDRATFTGADSLNHVISRVTGGNISNIDGTLASSVGGADLWVINPAGVAFGPNAAIDVPASLHVSTAGELRLTDGTSFNAANPNASSLSVAEPAAFGFFGSNAGNITVDRSTLTVPAGKSLSLTAGGIDIRGGETGMLSASTGRIVLAAAADASQVTLDAGIPEGVAKGDIRLSERATIDVSGNGAGSLLIDGGAVSIVGSSLVANNNSGGANAYGQSVLKADNLFMEFGYFTSDNFGGGRGAGLSVDVAGAIGLIDQGRIASGSYDDGQAGNVYVQADRISIDNTAPRPYLTGISSNTVFDESRRLSGAGPAGSVNVIANSIEIRNGGQILSDSFGFGSAGTVSVVAQEIGIGGNFDGAVFTGISSSSAPDVTGAAGIVNISASDIVIEQSGGLASSSGGSGPGGAINVQADRLSVFDGGYITGEAESSGSGGNISIDVGTLEVVRSGNISTNALAEGDAGLIAVTANTAIVDGIGADGVRTTISSNAGVSASGDAGIVSIDAQELFVNRGAQISSSTFGAGNAGVVLIEGGRVVVDRVSSDYGLTGILGNANSGSSGTGGAVSIVSQSLEVYRGAQIASTTFGPGDAGGIIVETDNLTMDGFDVFDLATGMFSNSDKGATGAAGSITIDARSLQLYRGAQIGSGTFGQGNAGALFVNADTLTINTIDPAHNAAGIFSNANFGSSGDAGFVNVTSADTVIMNGGRIASSTFGSGNAGTVTLDIQSLEMRKNAQFAGGITGVNSRAEPESTGDAGQIFVTAGSLTLLDGTRLNSSTFGAGNAGGISIDADSIAVLGTDANGIASAIVSNSEAQSTGNAGLVTIAANSIDLIDNGLINSSTFSSGSGGGVAIDVGRLSINRIESVVGLTGISSSAEAGSTGDAGNVGIDAEAIDIRNGGQILSGTFSQGSAGSIEINAGRIEVFGANDAAIFTGIGSNAERETLGNAGSVSIDAGFVGLRDFATISSRAAGEGNAGTVDVAADEIVLIDGGEINSSTFATGDAGQVRIDVATLTIDGAGDFDGRTAISSNAAAGSSGNAGQVVVGADAIRLLNEGQIGASTDGRGDAGQVSVNVRELLIESEGKVLSNTTLSGNAGTIAVRADTLIVDGGGFVDVTTGITSAAERTSSGNAGNVTITAGFLGLQSAGTITSRTEGQGNAGSVEVVADEVVLIDGASITSSTATNGFAGSVDLEVGSLIVDGIGQTPALTSVSSNALEGSTGDAGQTVVRADSIQLINNGQIASNTGGNGNAGQVFVDARQLTIDPEGKILSITTGIGDAGTIVVDADNALIDGGAFTGIKTGIASAAVEGSIGAGGQVFVSAENLELRQGGEITSSTFASGNAGDVDIEATSLRIDGLFFDRNEIVTEISSRAEASSSGNAGSVSITAADVELSRLGAINSSTFSIGNAGLVSIDAKRLRLPDSGIVASDSFGAGNAGDIRINADQLLANASTIRTSGATAAGGRIDIFSKQAIRIGDTEITTSGELPAAGASLLRLEAPFVEILDGSRVLSLTGGPITPETGVRSGEAAVDGVITVISDDSEIAASTDVVIQGLDAELGSELQLQSVSPIAVDNLLPASCATSRSDSASTLTSATGSKLGAQPDSPLTALSGSDQLAMDCSGS